MEKFGRRFELTIQPPQTISARALVIETPLSAEVSVVRNTLASANTLDVTIHNLAANTRNAIFKDRYDTVSYWGVRLRAGYGGRLFQIFRGNILRSESYKEGPDWITRIECLDGLEAVQNNFVSISLTDGATRRNAIDAALGSMPNILSGFFGEDTLEQAARGQVYFGPAVDALDEITDGGYYIDSETLNVMADDEVVPEPVIAIDPRQLLTTPKRNDTYLDVDVLFSPEITVGQVIRLESLERIYNGDYKVEGFEHNVMFSESVAGDARTTLNLFAGAGALRTARR